MLKDVGMTMLKVQEQDAVYVGKTSDDGMRNKEQHEGKGKGYGHATIVTCVTLPCIFFSCHHQVFPAYNSS